MKSYILKINEMVTHASQKQQTLSTHFLSCTYGPVSFLGGNLFLLHRCIFMLLPSETMLLLFIINYTFVLDARVLSMNRICAFWISHTKYSPTSLKLMLNCELIVWTEEWQEIITKRFSRLLKRLARKPWSQIVNALTVQTNKGVLLNFLL